MANQNFIVQNGINIGGTSGAVISADPTTGAVVIAPAPTATSPNPTAVVISTAGTVSTVATTAGVANVAAVSTASNTATATSLTTMANVLITGNLTVNGTATYTSTETVLGVEVVAGNLVANSGATSTSTTTGALVVTGGAGISGNLNVGGTTTFYGNVNPSANVTYSLGSRTQMWKDIFVGPGTLYVNGKAVIQDNSGTITFSTDANQNLQIATSGSGDLQFVTGTGAIALSGPIKVTAGKYFTSSDGNAIGFSNQIAVDALTSKSANTDLVITAAGTGKVQINDDMQVTGNLTVSGSTTTINTTNLSVADNIIDLNSTVTSGSPTLDGVTITSDVRDSHGKIYVCSVVVTSPTTFSVSYDATAAWNLGSAYWDIRFANNGVVFFSDTAVLNIVDNITVS
jgi:hypothetical protein